MSKTDLKTDYLYSFPFADDEAVSELSVDQIDEFVKQCNTDQSSDSDSSQSAQSTQNPKITLDLMPRYIDTYVQFFTELAKKYHYPPKVQQIIQQLYSLDFNLQENQPQILNKLNELKTIINDARSQK